MPRLPWKVFDSLGTEVQDHLTCGGFWAPELLKKTSRSVQNMASTASIRLLFLRNWCLLDTKKTQISGFLASVFSPYRRLFISYEWHQPVLRCMSFLSNLTSQWKRCFFQRYVFNDFYVLISSYLTLQKPPMFSAHSSPSNLHLAITRLLLLRRAILQYIASPILCVRDPGGSRSEWTKKNRGPGHEIFEFWRVTITRLHQKKKKHMLCISTCWRCKVPLILVHKDMNEKSPLVIVIAIFCILDHETLSSRVHYCNGDHVLIKILLIRKPSMLTIHVNFKIYIYAYKNHPCQPVTTTCTSAWHFAIDSP